MEDDMKIVMENIRKSFFIVVMEFLTQQNVIKQRWWVVEFGFCNKEKLNFRWKLVENF